TGAPNSDMASMSIARTTNGDEGEKGLKGAFYFSSRVECPLFRGAHRQSIVPRIMLIAYLLFPDATVLGFFPSASATTRNASVSIVVLATVIVSLFSTSSCNWSHV